MQCTSEWVGRVVWLEEIRVWLLLGSLPSCVTGSPSQTGCPLASREPRMHRFCLNVLGRGGAPGVFQDPQPIPMFGNPGVRSCSLTGSRGEDGADSVCFRRPQQTWLGAEAPGDCSPETQAWGPQDARGRSPGRPIWGQAGAGRKRKARRAP